MQTISASSSKAHTLETWITEHLRKCEEEDSCAKMSLERTVILRGVPMAYQPYGIAVNRSYLWPVENRIRLELELVQYAIPHMVQTKIILHKKLCPLAFSRTHYFDTPKEAAEFLEMLMEPLPSCIVRDPVSATDYLCALNIPYMIQGVGKKGYVKIF